MVPFGTSGRNLMRSGESSSRSAVVHRFANAMILPPDFTTATGNRAI